MNSIINNIRVFFFSQPAADGLRITISVLLPALVASYFHSLQLGMLASLGALCVSLADAPGAIINRVNTMLFCLFFVFVTALLTGLVRGSLPALGAAVLFSSFFFSMFQVYGTRGAAVGNAALLVLVLSMDHGALPLGFGMQAFFILGGGLLYMLVSLIDYRAAPYRPAQRSLGECIRELAYFLHIKAAFYNGSVELEKNYDKLVTQQIVVSEKQDAVREVLFKTRLVVAGSTTKGRRLLLAFIDTVDLFEEITATYQDYASLRSHFGPQGILSKIGTLAHKMAQELDSIGIAIQTNRSFTPQLHVDAELQQLQTAIALLTQAPGRKDTLVLQKLLVNIRSMLQRLSDLRRYFTGTPPITTNNQLPLERFVGHQSLDPKLLLDNMNMQSAIFRHSLRVAIAALIGFMVSKFIAQGHYSYWILMTIIFMLKPSFSLTRQRNVERITGTIAGGGIGILLLLIIPNKQALFALMVFFMLGTYSFMRIRYLLSVVCMTPFILILFHLLGVSFINLLQERMIDTLLGCLIALLAGYLLFPAWEREQLAGYLKDMLQANINYLIRVAELLGGQPVNITDYKIARKEVYVSSANLSAAFQRMLSEPKTKQVNKMALHQFVVLNHILFSNTATIAAPMLHAGKKTYAPQIMQALRKVLYTLCGGLRQINGRVPEIPMLAAGAENQAFNEDDQLMKEQLEFMNRLSEDIVKATLNIQNQKLPGAVTPQGA